MDADRIFLPNMARIQIITEQDQMIAAMDREKAQLGKSGFGKPEKEQDRICNEIQGICDRQAELLQQAKRIRGLVCTLVEEGAYWAAFEALSPVEAKRVRSALEPIVQKARERQAQLEVVQ